MTGAEFGEVDIDLLADYIGGALAGTPDETAVAARIAEDPAWRTAYESLSGGMDLVGAELGRWQSEPMPDELAASLDAMFRAEPPAIDREAPSTSRDESSTAGRAPGTSRDGSPTAGRAPGTSRDGSPTAGRAPGSGPGAPRLTVIDGEGGASGAAPAVPKKEGRRRRWTAPIAVAAGLIAFVGFGLDYLSGRDSASNDAATSTAGEAGVSAMRILSSGTDYTLGTLAGQPPQPLSAPDLPAPAAPRKDTADRSSAAAGALSRLAAAPALQECLDAIEQANGGGRIAVETVDFARFDGSPAVIVRFTAANGGGWAWASGPDCGTPGSGPATLGKVPVR
nr:hypothetical protein [uncultured Actinoplanes sp.]